LHCLKFTTLWFLMQLLKFWKNVYSVYRNDLYVFSNRRPGRYWYNCWPSLLKLFLFHKSCICWLCPKTCVHSYMKFYFFKQLHNIRDFYFHSFIFFIGGGGGLLYFRSIDHYFIIKVRDIQMIAHCYTRRITSKECLAEPIDVSNITITWSTIFFLKICDFLFVVNWKWSFRWSVLQ
jgi:hypothetical protein